MVRIEEPYLTTANILEIKSKSHKKPVDVVHVIHTRGQVTLAGGALGPHSALASQ
jgi:hypothetical protein